MLEFGEGCILESSAGVIGMLVHILELLLAILVMKIGKQVRHNIPISHTVTRP